MKPSQLSTILGLALLSASGCGKAAPAQIQQELPDPAPTQAQALSDSIRQMDTASVFCKDENNCVPGAALLVAAHADRLERCTGFLVSNRILMTHRDCIPAELRHPGAACSNRIRALFPASPLARAETIDCDRVLSISDSLDPANIADLDYVFLSLKTAAARKPLKVSTDGVDTMELNVVRFEPTSVTEPIGKIATVKCKSVLRSSLLPSYTDSNSPVISLVGCDTPAGSGGAPVVDASGQVRALLQPPISGSTLGFVYGPQILDPLAFATNLTCVEGPIGDLSKTPPAGCLVKPNRASFLNAYLQNIASLESETRVLLSEKSKQWQPDSEFANVIRWKLASRIPPNKSLTSSFLDAQYFPVPDCFNDPEGWYRRFRTLFGLEVKHHETVKFNLPIWQVSLTRNSALQNQLSINLAGYPATTLDFEPKAVRHYNSGKVSLSTTVSGSDTIEFKADSLPRCSN